MSDSSNGPPDLLLISWNRREYLEKTLRNLLADPAEFRLYCWDNASEDGAADLIASLSDSRVVRKHFSRENLVQYDPTLWFFEEATSDLVGKIDDDILLPQGWTGRIAPLLRREPRFGMLGCWIFMPEDWHEPAEHRVVEIGGARVLRLISRAGQSFLARREHLRRYVRPRGETHGFPVDQVQMTLEGFVHGHPLPPLMAHNMDDPRSEHSMMRQSGKIGEHAALTARKRGFETPEAYIEWIRADARSQLVGSLEDEIRRARRRRDRSLLGRVRRRLARIAGR